MRFNGKTFVQEFLEEILSNLLMHSSISDDSALNMPCHSIPADTSGHIDYSRHTPVDRLDPSFEEHP
jgi:hypothetical protein